MRGAFEDTALTNVTIPENTVNVETAAFGESVKILQFQKV